MGLRFKESKFGQCFFVTSTFRDWCLFGEVDGFYAALATSLSFCGDKYRALTIGYVFMPTHIHLLLLIEGRDLPNLMRDFKKYTAQKVVTDLGLGKGGIWMPRYDRVVIYTESVLHRKLDYIHHNPVKATLVEKPEEWEWSSTAHYFSDKTGPVPVWKGWG